MKSATEAVKLLAGMSLQEKEPTTSTKRMLEPCMKLPLDSAIFSELVGDARDFALLNGAGMRLRSSFCEDSIYVAPFTLLPSTFPRSEFEKAVKIQTVLNELMYKVAHDYEFLRDSLKTTILVDSFTAKLFEIYETVRREGIAQDLSLGLFRSDYMMTQTPGPRKAPRILQVEFNTIASSFGSLMPTVCDAHRYVLSSLGQLDKLANIPDNNALQGLCSGLVRGWELYGNSSAVILFLVEDVTYNIADQRFMQFEVQKQNPRIRVIRRNIQEMTSRAALGDDKNLLIDGLEVSVVYFRCGYDPCFYHNDADWATRLLIERSKAIKCPSINFHLAGTKKVQQVLGKRSVLERFIQNSADVDRIQEMFTGLYSLDQDEEGDASAEMAIANPEAFVMKPQREGGGNNVYGVEVKNVLEKLGRCRERSAYILMDRIFPPSQLNYIIRPNQPHAPDLSEVVSELGIYGVLIGTPGKIMDNRQVGHVLRTKLCSANEGGVAAGVGALDSPFLVD